MKWLAEIIPDEYEMTLKEVFWVFCTAVGLEALQILATLEFERVTDWRSWSISVAGALIRTGAGAVLSWRSKKS